MSKYVTQTMWIDAIMGLVENLDRDGQEELFKRVEAEAYYNESTREDMESTIADLESEVDDLESEVDDLKSEIEELKEAENE